MLGERDEVFLFRAGDGVLEDELALAAHAAADLDDAVDLGDLARVLRTAGLEEFRHARQAARDVLGLGDLARGLGQQRAGLDLLAFVHDDVRAGRDRVAGDDCVLLAEQDDLRMQVFLVLDDHRAHDARRLVDLALHGDARDHVAEVHLARLLREDRHVVRIPLREGLALLDLLAFAERDDRADDHVVALEFAAVLAVDRHRAVLGQHDVAAFERLHAAEVVEPHLAVVFGLDDRLLERLAGRAADVERTHRQLRAGLADALRRDDAHRLAELDRSCRSPGCGRSTSRTRRAGSRR